MSVVARPNERQDRPEDLLLSQSPIFGNVADDRWLDVSAVCTVGLAAGDQPALALSNFDVVQPLVELVLLDHRRASTGRLLCWTLAPPLRSDGGFPEHVLIGRV